MFIHWGAGAMQRDALGCVQEGVSAFGAPVLASKMQQDKKTILKIRLLKICCIAHMFISSVPTDNWAVTLNFPRHPEPSPVTLNWFQGLLFTLRDAETSSA